MAQSSKRSTIAEGMAEYREAVADAEKAYEALKACHCCCCTGECTGVFEDSTPEEQEEWMRAYWAQYS